MNGIGFLVNFLISKDAVLTLQSKLAVSPYPRNIKDKDGVNRYSPCSKNGLPTTTRPDADISQLMRSGLHKDSMRNADSRFWLHQKKMMKPY